MSEYNFSAIEKKWQKYWLENKTFRTTDGTDGRSGAPVPQPKDVRPKFYCLDMFPYPSGAGLHVGHPEGYTATDILCRYKRMKGFNVLHPMGWDAFGLPAEQYAVETGTHPAITTKKNVDRFREQIRALGFSYDWDREVNTTDPKYYRWTQWIFEQLYKKGLAYVAEVPVNWCPALGTVLANEEVIDGRSERGNHPVIRRPMRQWMLKITEYAERLLNDLDTLDWPEGIKEMQRNWIGKSTGALVDFGVEGVEGDVITVYTTRCDTLYGVTFMVVAPEHPILDKYKDQITNFDEVEAYRQEAAKKTEFERTQLVKDKTGVCIKGLAGINPVTGKEIPIFISDYVMMGYGTGAIMAVPAHDQRDYDFAKKFGIDIIQVIKGGDISKEAYTGDGEMINSGFLNGMTNKKDSIAKMREYLKEKGIGHKGVQYKMKDWAFNRQRYWGEPIPLIHCPKCGTVGVPEDQLPLMLPDVKNFEPGQDGQSPLAKIPEFVNCTCPKCGGPAKRETDTMPQWAGSSWYFLRFCDPHNDKAFADRKKIDYWMPVDHYNGGMEHVTRHLLYSRFWHHFLYDIGEVNTPEPYAKRTYQGLILGADGEKMSKSKGNVIDPVDIVNSYGADTLRTYVLFMGDYGSAAPWSDESLRGCKRFLDRVYNLTEIMTAKDEDPDIDSKLQKTIRKVSDDTENMKFNTAIAALMTLLNEYTKKGAVTKYDVETFLKLLSPFAPHICEELWEQIGCNPDGKTFVTLSAWPECDDSRINDTTVRIGVQVNGKVRGSIEIAPDCSKEDAIAAAGKEENVAKYLEGGKIIKEIYVPGKILNLVVKPQ